MIPTVFRRHNDGTITDVFEDACSWVRDDSPIEAFCDVSDAEVLIVMNNPPRSFSEIRECFAANAVSTRIEYRHPDGQKSQVTRQDFGL